jgi:predicted metal-dependent phosphoesterase TrpH
VGISVVQGIVLRVETPGQRIDLLGYGVEQTPELLDLVERLQTDRIDRAKAIVDCIESRLGVELDVSFEPGVGRPHIGRAVAESKADLDYAAAFEELIGDGCPCYVARDIPSFETGRQILDRSCTLVGLAHPFRYDDTGAALDRAKTLEAIEVAYPYGSDVDTEPAARVAQEHDLIVTGGSDAHDETLGLAGIEGDAYARFRSCLDI